ncbi:nuclear transport factor 2 family protein [Chloroflexi bacterium TSY]|nr:nuclear transport factor 2 family protein [Chloroflexi bacterium TSY]
MNSSLFNTQSTFLLVLVILLLSACVPIAPVAVSGPTNGEQPAEAIVLDPAVIETTSRAFFSTMLAGDMDGWLATLAADAVSYEPVGSPPNVGHEGLLAWAGSMSGFDSVNIELHDLFVAGNSAAITWTSTFILPGGEAIAINGVDVHEYNSAGTIQTVKGYFDPMPLMAAMSPKE